jgi:1-acyl-sn-glycerol-3-phosphate acyltransferase
MHLKEKSPPLFLIGRQMFRIMFSLFYRWSVEGLENVPTGGAIIAPNHMSFFDPPLTGAALKRPLYFMAKRNLFDIPVLGWVIERTNAFPVDRGGRDIAAVKKAFYLLKKGYLLLMFPEGTRSKNGKMGKAKAGVGMVACNAQVPLVPVKIENTDKMLMFKRVKIRFGRPIYPPKHFVKYDYMDLSQRVLDTIAVM